MCLQVFPKNTPGEEPTHQDIIPKVAKKPIEVYKVLHCNAFGEYWTPFRPMRLRFIFGAAFLDSGGMEGTISFCEPDEFLPMTSGYLKVKWRGKKPIYYNCYKDDNERVRKDFSDMTPHYLEIDCGIHAFREFPSETSLRWSLAFNMKPGYKVVVMKGVIPRGTKYFEGTDGDIVADRMILYKNEQVCV